MSFPPKVLTTFLLFVWLLMPWSYLSAAETGISFNTATEIPVWNQVFSVDKVAGQDGYLKFHLHQGEGVAISLKANVNSGSQYIQFYQPDIITSAFISTTRSYGDVVATSFTAAVSGTYWMRVMGSVGIADIGVYRAFYNSDVTDTERGFYSTFNTAQYFTPGEYSLTDLPQFYRFEARVGDEIAISLSPSVSSSFQRLEVFQPDNLTNSMVSTGATYNNSTGTASFTARTTGVYYARVSGAAGRFVLSAVGVRADADDDSDGFSNTAEFARRSRIDLADSNGDGSNDLQSARLGLIGVFEKEFSRADLSEARSVPYAREIPYFDKRFSVNHDGSERFFSFYLREGEGATLELTARLNTGSQFLSVIQPDDHERVFISSSVARDGESVSVSFYAAVAGTYYLRLAGAVGTAELAVYNAFFNPDVVDDTRDYNGTFYTAKYLTSGTFAQSTANGVHRFVARVGDQVSLSLTPNINAGSQRLSIYQPGVLNTSFLISSSLNNNQTGILSFTVQTDGVYFAVVTGAMGFYNLNAVGVRADMDTDGDGVSDSVEWFRGSRPDVIDTNANGLTDLEEARNGAFGIYLTELTRSDVKNADSLLSALPIPYFDKTFSVRHNGNHRFFSMDLNEGEGVALALTPRTNSGSMSLLVYQPYNQNNNITSISNTSNNDTRITSFTANISGTYYFRLSGVVGIAELAVYRGFFNPGVTDHSREFYGSANTAEYLRSGQYNLGVPDRYHRFEARAGDEVTLNLTGGANSGGQSMQLFGPESGSSFRSTPSVLRNQVTTASFIAQTTGVYFVKVTGNRGTYRLDATGIRPDADDDQDGLSNTAELARGTRIDLVDTNNNGFTDYQEALAGRLGIYPVQYSRADLSHASSFAFAKPVPYKDKPFSIAFDGNHRYFAFEVTAGEGVTITLTPRISSSYQYLTVYAANNQSTPLLSPNGVSNGDTLSVSFTATVSGTHWVRLEGSMGGADLAVYNAFFNAGVEDSQRDFYGSFNTAQLLVSGTYTKQENLYSFFRFDAVAGEDVSLSLAASVTSGSMSFSVFQPGNLSTAFVHSNLAYNNQTVNRTFTAATTGTYYVRVNGAGGRFNLQAAGITPIIFGAVGVAKAIGENEDDFTFTLRLASPLKEGQFVALSFVDQNTNEFVNMNCSGTECTLTRRLNLPSLSVFHAGVYDANQQLIGNVTSSARCTLPQCLFSFTVTGNGVVRYLNNVLPQFGRPLRLEVIPGQGYKASRAVAGSCSRGTWITSTIYEIAELVQPCSATFHFAEEKKRKRFPMWLLTLEP